MKNLKVLVVVDYQNDFVNGALGFEGAERLDEGIANKIREYHNNGDIVICTFDTHHGDYLDTQEGRNLPIKHCIEGTDGWKLYKRTAEAAYECGAIAVKKGAFASIDSGIVNILNMLKGTGDNSEGTMFRVNEQGEAYLDVKKGLDMIYRHHGCNNIISEVEICGLITNVCVIANATLIKWAEPEARIKVLAGLCDSNDKEAHQVALKAMKSLQMEVIE